MNSNTYILGLSALYHDSSAVLIKNEDIIAAVQEERFTRKKFDNSFPINSINYCLKKAKIKEDSLKKIIFFENPDIKLDRIIKSLSAYKPLKFIKNYKIINNWLNNKYNINNYIENYLPNYDGEVLYSQHHLSHAASAFYPSHFENSNILIIDGVGEWASSSILYGKNEDIELLKQQNFPNSLGILYSAFTSYLGFKILSGEYKMMGLAPYGDPVFYNKIMDNLVYLNKDGSFFLNDDYFDFLNEKKIYNKKFDNLFGSIERNSSEDIQAYHCNLASSIQKVTEEIIFLMINHAISLTGNKNICLAGGVALNCVANGKIKKQTNIENIWIQPASGDAGGAIGSCLYYLHGVKKIKRDIKKNIQKYSYLGPSFSNEEIKHYLESYNFKFNQFKKQEAIKKVSEYLQDGKVIGLFQSKMEFGPRALGNRSIIGDPRVPDMQKKMNLKIKFRESFRPFAPAILEEKVSEWFELEGKSPYMLMTSMLKEVHRIYPNNEDINLSGVKKINSIRSSVPAITHVDFSARIQTVSKDSNEIFYNILNKFYEDTGCPILINTSFNVRSEPIVNSPFDALKCFMNTDMDILFIGDFILQKEYQGNILKEDEFIKSFELD